jgi:ABC-2 type transport system ATP-binding protein
MSSAVARFSHVVKTYPAGWLGRSPLTALADVSFAVEPGEIFGILGPNRAGKTTLIKVLLSLTRATHGLAERMGRPVADRTTLGAVGYVHESQAFPRYLTATRLLEYYAALNYENGPWIRRRAGELIERFGLADRCHEPIARFSKGMLQRLALAQALINSPRLLVLDEPSEGMDLLARQLLHETLEEHRARGRAAILVSHSPTDVARLCDRVAVMRGGQAVFVGSLDVLRRSAADVAPEEQLEGALKRLYTDDATSPALPVVPHLEPAEICA